MAKTQTTEKVKKNTTNEFEVTRTVVRTVDKKELMKEIEKLEGVLQDKRKGAGIDSLEAEIAKKKQLLDDINNSK